MDVHQNFTSPCNFISVIQEDTLKYIEENLQLKIDISTSPQS